MSSELAPEMDGLSGFVDENTRALRDLLAVADFGTRYSILEAPEVVTFGVNNPTRWQYSGGSFASVAIINPNAFPVYVGLGASAGKPGAEFVTVAAAGYMVIPLKGDYFSIGGGPNAGTCYVLPFQVPQPFAAGALGPNPVNIGVPLASTVGTTSAIVGAAVSTVLQAANANRVGLSIVNDSASILYVKLGAAASLVDWSVQLDPGDYFEMPSGYSGVVTGIWAVADGHARVTELT